MPQSPTPISPPPDLLTGLRCPACDYDLTGLRDHRCPECGTEFDPAKLRDPARETSPDSQSLWRSVRLLLAMEAVLFILQLVGVAIAAVDPADRVTPRWLEDVAYLAAVPGAVIAQPILLLLSLVEAYRARNAGEDRIAAAAGLTAILALLGILLLLHLLSQAYR